MPFTPFHMGPGLLVKALLQGSFSLMVFGWTQVVMDLQPLIAILTDQGQLHGFTHTYVGAALIAIFSAVSGKYLSQWGLAILSCGTLRDINIRWWVAFLSAFVGSFSHVVLDSIMHADMEPLYPFSLTNSLLGFVSISTLYEICVYSGLAGAAVYIAVHYWLFGTVTMFNANATKKLSK